MEIGLGFKLLSWIIFSILSAILYRMGGSDKYNTKWRDIGCALCAITLLVILKCFVFNVSSLIGLVVMFGLTFASLTTYFKKEGSGAKWWNWLFVGLAFGVAALPFSIATHAWWGFILRTIFLGASVCLWSEWVGNVVWEEAGRGFLLVFSIPLLLM